MEINIIWILFRTYYTNELSGRRLYSKSILGLNQIITFHISTAPLWQASSYIYIYTHTNIKLPDRSREREYIRHGSSEESFIKCQTQTSINYRNNTSDQQIPTNHPHFNNRLSDRSIKSSSNTRIFPTLLPPLFLPNLLPLQNRTRPQEIHPHQCIT